MSFKSSKFSRIAVFLVITLSALWLGSCVEDAFVTPRIFGKITGKIIDNASKKPLSDVLIKLNPSGRSLQTDSTGNFTFDSLIAGKYTLSAERTGLYNEYVTVEVTDLQNPVVTIYMSEDIKTNRAPSKPINPIPAVGTAVTGVNGVLLAWTATDPDRDTLTYDVYLFKGGTAPATPYVSNHNNDTLFVDGLEYDQTYYWQVVAKDKREAVNSAIWSFTTPKFPQLSYVFAREEAGKFQIYSGSDNKSIVKLTTEGSNWRPVVSPNREQVAFISNRSTNLHIYVVNRDGSGLRKITNVPISGLVSLDLSFCWANNGSRIIYPNNNKLFSVNLDGTGLIEVARAPSGQQFAGCDWNEATKTIIARTTGETVYDNELTLIYQSGFKETVLRSTRRVSNPVLSIDGGEILFSMDINDFKDEQGRQADAHMFQMILEGRGLNDLSQVSGNNNATLKPKGTNDLDPRYSPTGQGIIFTNVNNDGVAAPNLYKSDLEGKNREKIIDNGQMGFWRWQ